ncbi:S8 family serine peptidase [Candidatus Woesearchaeota archaeon]|nr:S8 family serine peptidase [Candidatus Woesearchaeota archaeon]
MLLVFLVFLIAISIVISQDNNSHKVDHEIIEMFKDNDEVSVIVVLEDDYSVLGEVSVSSLSKNNFDKKKLMVAKQQDKVLDKLNVKGKSGEVGISSSSYDLDLRHKFPITNGFSGKLTKNGLNKLLSNPSLKSIELDRPVQISLDTSKNHVNASNTWKLIYNGTNLTGKHETVCVIDTGVNYNHSALGNGWGVKVIGGYRSLSNGGNQVECEGNNVQCFDDHSHGTHVAGIVASTDSTYTGIAPDSKIIAVKVLDSGGSGFASDAVSGINWCVNNASIFNISIISMSLGGIINYSGNCNQDEAAYASAIDSAYAQNISVIVAAGNQYNYSAMNSPSCIANATSVGSLSDSDAISSFSNRNGNTSLFAPGESITSANYAGGFLTQSGTSMATPVVSGAFALLYQYFKLTENRNASPDEIEDYLNDTGKQVTDPSNGLTYSRVNIFAAIESQDSLVPEISFVFPTPANNSQVNESYLFINITSNEVLINASLEFNGTNETMEGTSLNWYKNKSFTGNQPTYSYKVWGNDSFGNYGLSELREFIFNNTAPNITSFSPTELDFSLVEGNFNFTFNVSVFDINSDTITLSWYRNGTLEATNSNYTLQNNLSLVGFYNITVIASDSIANDSLHWNLTINHSCYTPHEISNITTNTTYCAGETFNIPNGISIGANNVVLNCNGSILNGNGSNNGIYLSNIDNSVIKNCSFLNYSKGIFLDSSDNNNLSNNNISFYVSNSNGIYLQTGSDDNDISNNFIYGNSSSGNDVGISIRFSSRNLIYNNNVSDGETGINLISSSDNRVHKNKIFRTENGGVGLSLSSSSNNNITNNTLIDNPNKAVILTDSSTNYLMYNIIKDNGGGGEEPNPVTGGIWIYPNSSNNTIINNSIYNNTQFNLYNNQTHNLSTEFNFWGTTSLDEIDSKIYDNSNDSSLGIVDFNPWYVNAEFSEDSDADNDGFSNSSLGGLDCNDANSSIYPNATELRNSVDDDCDNIVDEGFVIGNASDFNSTIPNLNITINQSSDLSKEFNQTQSIVIKNATYTFVEFEFNLSSSGLNLSNITIERHDSSSSQGALLVKGIKVSSETTKTAYIENISLLQGVCINDAEIDSIGNISSNCSATSETFVACPGSKGQYNCTQNGSVWKVQGLNNSGVQQQNDTLAPVIEEISTSNSGSSTITVTLSVTTDENSTCKYDTTNKSYENLTFMSSTNSSSHSNAISYSSDTSGTYFVRCNDTFGNVMSFSNFTSFNADVTEGTSSSSSSSGGGGGGGGSGGGGGGKATVVGTKKTYSYALLTKGQNIVMNIGKVSIPFSSISFTTKNQVKDAEVTIEAISKEDASPRLLDHVHQYLKIDLEKISDADISSAEITFDVNKTWLTKNRLDEKTVVLKRYNNVWQDLDTKKVSSNSNKITYQAVSPGFSLFAITASKIEVKEKVESKVIENKTEIVEKVVDVPVTEEKKRKFGPIITTLILALGVFAYWRFSKIAKKKQKHHAVHHEHHSHKKEDHQVKHAPHKHKEHHETHHKHHPKHKHKEHKKH